MKLSIIMTGIYSIFMILYGFYGFKDTFNVKFEGIPPFCIYMGINILTICMALLGANKMFQYYKSLSKINM